MLEKVQKSALAMIDRLRDIQDIRVVGLILFGVIALLVSWSGIRAIDANYRLQKEISALQQENSVDDLSNQNMELENEYFKSEQYLELSARQNFGLAKPGETLIVIPKDVARANAVEVPTTDSGEVIESVQKLPKYQQNLRAWTDFFLHRQHVVEAAED